MNSIRFKIFLLIIVLSLASFIGFGIFIVNSIELRKIAGDFSENYNGSLAGESFNEFNAFLDSIQASSGISQALGETFYSIRNRMSRQQLEDAMLNEYRTAFARETLLLGGGAFYEPNAFYQNTYDFHCFVSKVLAAGGNLPSEKNVQWAGDEWEWDVDTYEEGWYQIALPKGWDRSKPRDMHYHWSELYVDTSVDVLMVSVCMPIYGRNENLKTQQITGVATVDVSLSTLQKMVSSFTLPTKSAQMAGFSTVNEATFAATGSSETGIVPYPKNSWLTELSRLKPGQRFANDNLVLNGESYTLQASVHGSGIGLAILVPNAEKHEAVNAIQRTNLLVAIIICLVVLAIIVVTIIALSHWIVTPIKQASRVFETLAQGDLTQNIVVKGRDELSQMMLTLSQTQDGIRNLIVNIKNKAAELSSLGMELSTNMNNTAAATHEISSNVDSIKAQVLSQSASVTETNATMEQITANINKVSGHVEHQTESVAQSSSAIEEMIANIQSVTNTLMNNVKNVNELIESSDVGRTGMQEVASDIKEIARESEGLLEINSVMQNIASQTNLLSMNAAIEAAHAGEAGKGFAVVADEIRKLAENSGKQSKTISTVLKKIKSSIDKIIVSTDNVLKKFEAIDSGVKLVADQEQNIRNAMEEQSQGSKQILEAIGNVNDITRLVKTGSEEMLEGSKEVVHESRNLEKVTQELTGSMNEMAAGTDHINSAVNRVNDLSGKTRENIDLLVQEVSRFKVE